MTEEGAPAAEGEKPAAAPGADTGSTGYDYRKVHSYPLIKVSSYSETRIKVCIVALGIPTRIFTSLKIVTLPFAAT